MALSDKDREDFLRRRAAMRKVRALMAGVASMEGVEPVQKWNDEDIEAAIKQGF